MAVDAPIPPAESLEAVSVATRALWSRRREMLGGARRSRDGLTLAAPHPVYVFGLKALLEPSFDPGATETGTWRYLVQDRGRAIAAVESASPAGVHRFAQLNESVPGSADLPLETERAIRLAEADHDIRAGNFSLALFRVPALYLAALWLRRVGEGVDFLIGLAPTPHEVASGRPVDASTFVASLRPLAERRLREGDHRSN